MKIIPINVDRNVSTREYESAAARDALRIYSVFHTFQGEGPHAMKPSLFFRLAGCNIGAKEDCPWCDTKFDFDEGHILDFEAIRAALLRHRHQTEAVIFTGGEPLLQWPTLYKVMTRLRRSNAGHKLAIQIETNGLLLDGDMMQACADENIDVVLSPKVPHNRNGYRALPKVPIDFETAPHLFLKYVVEDDPSSHYYSVPTEALAAQTQGVAVYVSGMTVYKRTPEIGEVASAWDDTLIDRERTRANYKHAARLALQLGLRTNFQMHLFAEVE